MAGFWLLCKLRQRGTIWYSVTVMRISTATGGKAGYHIRRWPYVVWVGIFCMVQVRTWTFSIAHGLFVLANCYPIAGLFFPGGSDHSNWEFIMWAYVRIYIYLKKLYWIISFRMIGCWLLSSRKLKFIHRVSLFMSLNPNYRCLMYSIFGFPSNIKTVVTFIVQ